MFTGDDKVNERIHLDKLKHDPAYYDAHVSKHFHQQANGDIEGNRLLTSSSKVETPIGKGSYWEGQNGMGFGVMLFLWAVFTFAFIWLLCAVFGVGYFPPILAASGFLSVLIVGYIKRKLNGW